MDRGVIELTYSFFHQKLHVYEFSCIESQRDDIEYAISSYVDGMSPELYSLLSDGDSDFLRCHPSFESDLRNAVQRMEAIIC